MEPLYKTYLSADLLIETGHFWPVSMAHLAGVCTVNKWPA